MNNLVAIPPTTRSLIVNIVDAQPGDINRFFLKLPYISTLVVRLACAYESTVELLTVAYHYLSNLKLIHIESCFISPMTVRCMHNFIQHRRGVVLDIYNAKCSCIEEVNKLKGTAVISGDFVEWFYYSEDRHNKEK